MDETWTEKLRLALEAFGELAEQLPEKNAAEAEVVPFEPHRLARESRKPLEEISPDDAIKTALMSLAAEDINADAALVIVRTGKGNMLFVGGADANDAVFMLETAKLAVLASPGQLSAPPKEEA